MILEYKERWLEALRSNTYTPGKTFLKQRLADGSYLFCPLGVAAELFYKEFKVRREERNELVFFGGLCGVLNQKLTDALGLSHRSQIKIADMNDKQYMSFSEIADWIEANE